MCSKKGEKNASSQHSFNFKMDTKCLIKGEKKNQRSLQWAASKIQKKKGKNKTRICPSITNTSLWATEAAKNALKLSLPLLTG